MRNLKKVLSLALALVMLLGMMVVGAGAATSFKDDADIKNQEAVAVLVGMGIMKGRGDGTNFEPAGTLTRAEAAKMIAQLDLGVEAADALVGNGTSPFSDVWSGYWAEGAIDYCVEQGYIAGDGNGHFFPGRNVSSVEFGIMLLRLLGYDAKNEGLVGDQWATKGAALARKAGLTTSVAANTQPMTRDAMAQMAFNVLTATLVEYNGLNGTIGDATFSSPASPRYHNANDLGISNLTYDGKVPSATTTIKFCEEHFPNLKLVTGSRDDFEREYSVWTWKNVDIAGSKQIVTANFEFTEKKSSVNLNGAAGDANTEVYINGKPQSADDIKAIQSALSATQTGYVTSGVVAYLTQNGRQVLVYLNENNYKDIDKVVVIDTFVARVSAVSSANETTTVTTMSVPGTLDSRTVEMTGYAVGDIVAYTAAWNGSSKYVIQEMDVLTDPVTGTLTKWSGTSVVDADPTKGNSLSNFTIDSGDPYKYSYRKAIRSIDGSDVEIYSFTANKSELNVYLDKYGFALYVEGVEGEKNYAAVIGIGESNAYGSETKGVTLLLADGTTVEATAKLASGLAWSDFKGINAGTVGAWGGDSKNLVTDGVADVVTYTVDSKGVYTLTLVAHPTTSSNKTGNYDESNKGTAGSSETTFANGRSEMKINGTSYYTTSKTVFMVCTGTTNKSYNVYTGYANAPGIKAYSAGDNGVNGMAFGLNRRYTNQIDVVYIDASSMDNMTGASTYFVKSERPTVYTDSTGKYFVLPAIVDGEVTEIKIDAGLTKTWDGDNERLDQADAGLYAIDGVQKDENDIITGCTLKTASAAFRATNGPKNGTIAANGEVLGWGTSTKTFWAYNDKTNVFFVDKDYKTITKMAVADVQDDENDLIYADHDGSSGDKKLSNVVIVEQDPTPDAVTYTLSWGNAPAHVTGLSVTKVGTGAINSGDALTSADTFTVTATVETNYTLTITVGTQTKTIVGNGAAQTTAAFNMPAANTTITFNATYVDPSLVPQSNLSYVLRAGGTGNSTSPYIINVFYSGSTAPSDAQAINDIAAELGITDASNIDQSHATYVDFTVPNGMAKTFYRLYVADDSSIDRGIIAAYKGTIGTDTVFVAQTEQGGAGKVALDQLTDAMDGTTKLLNSDLGAAKTLATGKGTYAQANDAPTGLTTDVVNGADSKKYATIDTTTITGDGFVLTAGGYVKVDGDGVTANTIVPMNTEFTGVPTRAGSTATVNTSTGMKYTVGGVDKYVAYEGTIPAGDMVADITLAKDYVKVTVTVSAAGWALDEDQPADVPVLATATTNAIIFKIYNASNTGTSVSAATAALTGKTITLGTGSTAANGAVELHLSADAAITADSALTLSAVTAA